MPSGGATKKVIRKNAKPSPSPICRTIAGVWSAWASGFESVLGPGLAGTGSDISRKANGEKTPKREKFSGGFKAEFSGWAQFGNSAELF
jgi:hypothetical protein